MNIVCVPKKGIYPLFSISIIVWNEGSPHGIQVEKVILFPVLDEEEDKYYEAGIFFLVSGLVTAWRHVSSRENLLWYYLNCPPGLLDIKLMSNPKV